MGEYTSPFKSEDLVLLGSKDSFRHRVTKVDYKGRPIYRKQYADPQSLVQEKNALHDVLDSKPEIFSYPRVLAEDSNSLFLSEVAGEPFKTQLTDSSISQLALALRGLHTVKPVLTKVDDKVSLISQYLSTITQSDHMESADINVATRVAEELSTFFIQTVFEEKAFIHGDCNATNVLIDRAYDTIGLIDFERSSIDLPELDLARVSWRIFNNNQEQVNTMLRYYYGHEPDSTTVYRLQMAKLYEYYGAVAYYAWEGWQKKYPFYSEAISYLRQSCYS